MGKIKLFAALFIAKFFALVIRLLTSGGGTAAPGLYALKIDPKLIRKLSKSLKKGTIIVAGTNGKTTTSRMIAGILKDQGQTYIHNKEGSNLLRGVASAMAAKASLTGKVNADWAVWEIDEATLPLVLHEVRPQVIVLTNLFRDQLDRYGEVAKIRNIWQQALQQLPGETTLVLNADDPSIAHLGHNLQARTVYYGIDHPPRENVVSTTADANFCAVCSSPLSYEAIYYSHIGKYKCHKCGFERPTPSIVASNLREDENKTAVKITTDDWAGEGSIPLPGIYNVYNALAAFSATGELGLKKDDAIKSLETFSGVFGRVEAVDIDGKKAKLFLVKNPTGFNEVLHTLTHKDQAYEQLVIGINDNFADGRDVSWLWDVSFEMLQGKAKEVIATGLRSYDLAVRLKYAGIERTNVVSDFDSIITQLKPGDGTIPVLLTYTTMLSFRKHLVEKGYVKHYLKE